MSKIKVAIKIRPIIEHELKFGNEDHWISTDNNLLRCIDLVHACTFTFDHIFDKKCLNSDVYSSIVRPVVESCMAGFNGTILTYGQTSAGKNYTMMGSEKDPGILFLAIGELFNRIDHTLKIRVGCIEIYKERIYDLLNDRKQIEIDPNGKIELSNEEVPVDNLEKTIEILNHGSYKRKSSPRDDNKLSSVSHAIFRITIESEDKTNGKIRKSYLKFVHVAGCEPISEARSSDSLLRMKKSDDSNNSLLRLNFVINELSECRKEIDFSKSTLTALLKESLSGNSNTAIICNIKADVVEETLSTLKFAEQAKNIRTRPVRIGLYSDRPRSVDTSDMSPFEQRLKEMANTKVDNLLLLKALDEVKATLEAKTKWFEAQLRATEFARQKIILEQVEEKKMFDTIRYELEQRITNLNTSNQDLRTKCEELHESNEEKMVTIHKQKTSYDRLKKENSELKNKNDKLMNADGYETGIKRKIERLEDDWNKNMKKLKNEIHDKIAKAELSSPSERSGSTKSDETDASHTLSVSDEYVGCLIGAGGSVLKSICNRTGARLFFSERNGNPKRTIKIHGTADSVSMTVDLIEDKIKREKERRKDTNKL